MTLELRPNLDNLPDDVLSLIFRQLDLKELIRLKCIAKCLADRVDTLGIPLYSSLHRQPHLTSYPPINNWNPLNVIRYNHRINQSLSSHSFHALQIGPTWNQSVIPTLELTEDQLILGVGSKILVHPLVPPSSTTLEGGKVIDKSIEYNIENKKYQGGKSDIIGIVPIKSVENDLIIAQFDGTIQRVNLPHTSNNIEYRNSKLPRIKARYSASSKGKPKESINTLVGTTDGTRFMTTSISGKVDIFSSNSPWIEPNSLKLKSRAWSTLLTPSNAILGIQGSIEIYPLSSTGQILSHHKRILIGPENPLLSSPYSIHLPNSNQSNHNPNLLLSGWYDSHLRLHDLRSSSILPINQFIDPYTWSDNSAYYSTTYVGEYHIAGGNSKHGTVSFFDLRNLKSTINNNNNNNNNNNDQRKSEFGNSNWSCFSTGGKGSPVYSLKADNGNLYGVTEKRLFCLNFNGQGLIKNNLITQDLENLMNTLNCNKKNGNGRYIPNGYKGRGGKWSWTVKYDNNNEEYKGARGYEHRSRNIELFDSLIPA